MPRQQSEAVLAALKDVGWLPGQPEGVVGHGGGESAKAGRGACRPGPGAGGDGEEAVRHGELRPALRRLYDRAEADVRREESRQRLLDTSQTFYLEGWLPAERREAVQEALAPFPTAWELTEPSPEEYPAVPVKLKNNWLTRP